jgi:hypothetical protein
LAPVFLSVQASKVATSMSEPPAMALIEMGSL